MEKPAVLEEKGKLKPLDDETIFDDHEIGGG